MNVMTCSDEEEINHLWWQIYILCNYNMFA